MNRRIQLSLSIVFAKPVRHASTPPRRLATNPTSAFRRKRGSTGFSRSPIKAPRKPPAGWLPQYESEKQKYELYVPPKYNAKKSYPLILFISPGDKGAGWGNWKKVCEEQGILFASPHNAGNNCETKQRVRIVLDVLDDVRRKYNVDPDRTYIGGFSGGGRIACAIAFSLPEQFGGVIPVCAAGELREESWLRQRVIDRLSVANVTGENDFNRGEVERFRGPQLAEVGVRSKVWVCDGLGHGIPNADKLGDVFSWLEEDLSKRREFAKRYPASRISEENLSRESAAKQLFDEAEKRMKDPKTIYTGLMQMKGIMVRWDGLPVASQAKKILLAQEDAANRPWEEEDIAEQRRFLIAKAKSLDAYASGELPKQYANQRSDMIKASIELWKLVIADGQDRAATESAKKRIPVLEALLQKE